MESVAQPAAASPASASPSRWWIVVAAMTGAMLEVLDTTITSVAVPQMMGNLGATLSEIGWVTTGYIISNVIVLPMTGWLADRFGRKRYFAGSILLFTAASALCGASTSLSSLIFWRIVQGLGGAGLLATGQVILLDAFSETERGFATAIFGMGVMIGPLLGPTLGGYLTENFAWPAIFFINLPFGVLAALMTLWFVPNASYEHDAVATPIDYAGILLLVVGMGSLQTLLERGQEDDWWSSPFICALAVAAAIGLIGFTLWELHTSHPVLDIRLFRIPSLASGAMFGGLLGFSLYGVMFLVPVFLQNLRGYTAMQAGMVQLLPAIASTASFMLAGPLTQRCGAWRLLLLGTTLMAVGTGMLGALTMDSSVGDVQPGLFVRGMSLGFLFIPLTIASLAQLKPEQMGAGSGIINLMRQLGGSIGIAALSTVFSRREVFHHDSICAGLNPANIALSPWLQHGQALLATRGMSASAAHAATLANLAGMVEQQASVMSFNDSFLVTMVLIVLMIPLIACLRYRPGSSRP